MRLALILTSLSLTLGLFVFGPSSSFGGGRKQTADEALEQAYDAVAKGRDAQSLFKKVVDEFPGSSQANRAQLWLGKNRLSRIKPLHRSGPSSNRIDLPILSEAYSASSGDYRLFSRFAAFVSDFLFDSEVFGEYQNYFNVDEVYLISQDDRVDYRDRLYETALGGKQIGDVNQVVLDRRRTEEFLGALPHNDRLAFVLAQGGDDGVGSGEKGIGILPGEPIREEVMRVMGYAFAGLGAEFSTSNFVSQGIPTEAVNLSNQKDPRKVPWSHWIEALGRKIGVHEGGGGAFKGVFRPTPDGCVMRANREFCEVCREAIVLRIYESVCPIDEALPNHQPLTCTIKEKKLKVWVSPMIPERHGLDVNFYLNEAKGRKPNGLLVESMRDNGPNPTRGPWDRGEPAGKKVASKSGKVEGRFAHYVEVSRLISREKLKPGRYWLTAWVRDPGGVKGKYWVLKDPRGLLREVITWELVIQP